MTYFSLRNIAAVCGAIFVLALAYLILAEGHAAGAVFGAFSEQSFPAKLAWLIVVVVPLVLIPAAVWLGETLVRQRQAALALELRLDGVRQNVKGLVKSQVEAEMAVHQLVRTDPEDAVNALQQRLAEAGALLQTQQSQRDRRSRFTCRGGALPSAGFAATSWSDRGEAAFDRTAFC